ncbi:MAG: DNA polymerase III subunit [Elusimicrobiota bacterium]|jgi:DNA polymerase-3 subunit delta'|nr:DNA polymerase III subunit [Elusimicrobiota bacterium]
MLKNILGQKKVKQILSGQIKNNKFAHAYIFTGEDGIGKKTVAFEFAKILNCKTNDFLETDAGACGRCETCLKISKNSFADFHFIDFKKQLDINKKAPKKTESILIGTIRIIQEWLCLKTNEGKYKFCIIDPADKLGKDAANALLKMLEEPTKNTVIILIAKHKDSIIRTIISRSQVLFFQPLCEEDIINWLILNHSLDFDKAREIARLSEGSIEKAIAIASDTEADGVLIWQKFKSGNLYISDALKISKNISAKERAHVLKCIDAITACVKNDFRSHPKVYSQLIKFLIDAKSKLQQNANIQIVLDNLFSYLSTVYRN